MTRDEALAKCRREFEKQRKGQAALPMFCEHGVVIEECFSHIPGHWSPGFVRICASCGQELPG